MTGGGGCIVANWARGGTGLSFKMSSITVDAANPIGPAPGDCRRLGAACPVVARADGFAAR